MLHFCRYTIHSQDYTRKIKIRRKSYRKIIHCILTQRNIFFFYKINNHHQQFSFFAREIMNMQWTDVHTNENLAYIIFSWLLASFVQNDLSFRGCAGEGETTQSRWLTNLSRQHKLNNPSPYWFFFVESHDSDVSTLKIKCSDVTK